MSVGADQLLGGGPIMPFSRARITPSTRWTIGVLGLCVLLGCIVAVMQLLQDSERFPVEHVDVQGTVDYEDRQMLSAAIEKYTGEGFYGLDIDNIRVSVETLPWIAHARVSRVWPDRIEVHVEEHEPAARWNDDSLISKRLELFMPPQLQTDNSQYTQWREVFAELPQLSGAPGRHSALLDSFRDYERRLSRLGVSLDELREDERLSQTLQLSSQVSVRLGLEEREFRMSRFLDVYEGLLDKLGSDVQGDGTSRHGSATFDMRYSNGFSLGGEAAAMLTRVLSGKRNGS